MVLDSLTGAVDSYVESERDRWEETKRLGPIGTFKRDFQFGLTGPAPSLNPDFSTDFGSGPIEAINRTTYRAAGGDPDRATEPNPLFKAVATVLLIGAGLLALGQLFTFEVQL